MTVYEKRQEMDGDVGKKREAYHMHTIHMQYAIHVYSMCVFVSGEPLVSVVSLTRIT